MAVEEQEEDKNKRIRPWERAHGQKTEHFKHAFCYLVSVVCNSVKWLVNADCVGQEAKL